MYLSHVSRYPGIYLVAVVGLSLSLTKESCTRVGWEESRFTATPLQDRLFARVRVFLMSLFLNNH